MKKRTFFLAMVAALVAFAACNKEADTQITEGNSIEAVFEVSAPELATKAISDGLTATKLFFYLYDKNGDLLFNTNSSVSPAANAYPVTFDKLEDKKWSVKVRLIKDMQYQVVFWAQKPEADAFTLDAAAKTLSVNYSNMTLNKDDEDAFWGTTGVFTVDGPATKVVTLKRPFAQLNVAIPAEDLGVASFMLGKYSKSVAAITTNYTLSSYAYNTMNLLDGTVSENAAETTPLTLVAQAQPNADITIGDKTYKHMAMAYVLVGDKVTNDVTLTVNTGADAIGAAGVLTRDILNVPLQRNYRTNIIGNIFSVEEEFTVEVDNAFGETGTGAYGDVNVPDYVPTFGSIDALNAELAKGVNAVALDMTAVDGTINLPNTTEDIYLYILNDLSAAGNVLNVVYTEGAAAHPKNLYIYAKNLYQMDGTVPDTHVEVYSYSHIDTGTISTSGTTLVIQPFAYYGNLRILKGALKVEGKIQQATLDPVDPSVPINVTIVKDAEKDINGQIVILDVTDGTTTISTENATGGEASIPEGTPAEEQVPVVTVNVTSETTSAAPTNVTVNAEVTNLNNTAGTVTVNAEVEVVNTTGGGTTTAGEDVVEEEGKFVYAVAKIGDVKYASLVEAVADVPTDNTLTTITMLSDHAVVAGVTIAAEQYVVLELNGKTVSGNTDSASTYALITNKGTLVIQDNTDTQKDGTGAGVLTTYITNPDKQDVPGYASNTITNNGDLTIKSGKIVNNGVGYACYAIDNQTNGASYEPVVRIEGGRMQQMNAYTYAVRMFCNSTTKDNTAIVSGGVIEGGYGFWLQTPNVQANKAKLIISGGIFNARDGAAIYVGGTKAVNENISIDITGGTINGTGMIIQGPLSGTYGNVSISGGEMAKIQCGANVENFIKGGLFHAEPAEAYIADGFEAIENSGSWTIYQLVDYVFAEAEGIVTVNTSAGLEHVSANYADFRDSNHNLTIKLARNINMAGQVLTSFDVNNYTSTDKEIVCFTFDGQGHTLSGLTKMLIKNTWAGHSAVEVKNLIIDGAVIEEDVEDTAESLGVGAIIGYSDSSVSITLDNVTIQNSSVVGGHWTGGLIGYATGYDNANDGPQFTNVIVNDCKVMNTTVQGKGSVGAIVGHAAGSPAMLWEISNFTSQNNVLSNTIGRTDKTGILIGTIGAINKASSAFPDKKNGIYFTSPLTVSGNSVNGSSSNRKVGREGSEGSLSNVFLDGEPVGDGWMQ